MVTVLTDGRKAVHGAPYMEGDKVMVQVGGPRFREATVLTVDEVSEAIFGLRWRMVVVLEDILAPVPVYADDNGRNRTRGKQVMPYFPDLDEEV